MTTTFIICGNSETICDGYTDDRCDSSHEEIAMIAVDGAASVIRSALLGPDDYKVDSHFANWHGGKYSHQATMYGWEGVYVLCQADATAEIKELRDRAEAAFGVARDEYIANLEAEADAFDAEQEEEVNS